MSVPRQENEWSCISVLRVSIVLLPVILRLDFGTDPTVWYIKENYVIRPVESSNDTSYTSDYVSLLMTSPVYISLIYWWFMIFIWTCTEGINFICPFSDGTNYSIPLSVYPSGVNMSHTIVILLWTNSYKLYCQYFSLHLSTDWHAETFRGHHTKCSFRRNNDRKVHGKSSMTRK